MKVFVVNCGSSSIKYQLFDMADESVLAKGVLERVGTDDALLEHRKAGCEKGTYHVVAPDHGAGLGVILDALVSGDTAVLERIEQIDGTGHRVVHGGEEITGSARIDATVLDVIRRNAELAPLHNPPNLAGIEGAMRAMPSKPHVAVFDTAFLSTLPPRAFRYAVPDAWYREHRVRKYGFHGTSHRYVTLRAAEHLGKDVDEVNLITAHLGNGCSITAVRGGKAIDHSMGMTPLEGLMMGTRCGDLDPAVLTYMAGRGWEVERIDRALNKEAGLLGVSGMSNDMRDLLKAVEGGNAAADLAIEMFVYRLWKYVGAYYAVLPSVDALVLTGGIGENSWPVRWRLCQAAARLGAIGDAQRNEQTIRGQAGPITRDDSALPIWIVPTNEELMIARDTRALISGGKG